MKKLKSNASSGWHNVVYRLWLRNKWPLHAAMQSKASAKIVCVSFRSITWPKCGSVSSMQIQFTRNCSLHTFSCPTVRAPLFWHADVIAHLTFVRVRLRSSQCMSESLYLDLQIYYSMFGRTHLPIGAFYVLLFSVFMGMYVCGVRMRRFCELRRK